MRRALLLTLLALGACAHPSAEPALSLGSYAIDVSPATASFQLRRRGDVLLRFPADAIQLGTVGKLDDALSYDPFWLEYSDDVLKATPPPDLRFRKVTSMAITAHTASEVTLAYQLEGDASAMLTLRAEADGRFSARLIPSVKSGAVAYLRLRARAGSSEGFYGLGEWADQVNHRGKLRPMQMEADLSNESASNDAHVPVPLLIGTRGWGLFVESRRVGLFDVARKEDDLVEITFGTAEQSADGLAFHLFGAEHPLDITRRYYEVTGFPLLPAPWALGPWIWRDESKDQAEVLDDVKKIRELDLATSAIWIDRPYATAVNTFDFKASQFPDPAAMVGAIHDAGLRLALWHTPYLEKAAEPLASEAKAKGYFPPRPGTALNHWSDPLDLTNPEAYAWWQEHVRRYAALGIEGYKLDYAEDVLPGIAGGRNPWRFADGSDERTMHHGYVTLYHRLYAETLPASGGFLLCRAGRWGDQKNVSVIWPGDMDATFTKRGEPVPDGAKTVIGTGGLPAVLTMALSLGPSGFPFFGADTGGYRHSPPTKELFIRWVEQSALSM